MNRDRDFSFKKPNWDLSKSWKFKPLPTSSPPSKLKCGDKYELFIHQAKCQLNAAMDVIFHFLKDSGVSPATISDLQHRATDKPNSVLYEATQYAMALSPSYGGCIILLGGWEAAAQLTTLTYHRSLSIIRRFKLENPRGDVEELRRVNVELHVSAEACAASQLGLYKTRRWKRQIDMRSATL